MVVLIAETLALSCFTYCWVSMKLDCKVLKQDSKFWLRVWATRMREPKRGGWGNCFFPKNDMYECDKGEEMNPMEYCNDEMPKFLTRKKYVVTWQPEHNCVAIDLVCFDLFMLLSPRVLQIRVFPVL